MKGTEILKSGVRSAPGKRNRNKSYGIVIEMISNDYIDTLRYIINKICHSCEVIEAFSRSIFVAILKKPGLNEFELHWSISKILMNRERSIIIPGIGQKEYCFVTDTGIRNAIFIITMISERRIQMEKYVHLYFIDYAKYFDKVDHKSLFELLGKPGIFRKDFKIIQNLY